MSIAAINNFVTVIAYIVSTILFLLTTTTLSSQLIVLIPGGAALYWTLIGLIIAILTLTAVVKVASS